jgi:4-amino-4-deoxy-L-arabinose transferase-like glycosyltransferase
MTAPAQPTFLDERLLLDAARVSRRWAWTAASAWLPLVLAYAAALLPALAMSVAQPIWSRVDEAQHADVLAQYAHGAYPVEGRTTLRPETVAVMQATGVYRWAAPGAQPAPEELAPAAFTPLPAGIPPENRPAWLQRHTWWFSYEAMQPPLYYLLATPVWMIGDVLDGPVGGVRAARVLDALLLALLAPLTLVAARMLCPDRRVAWTAALLVALLPGLMLIGSAVTDDVMVAVLGAATAVLALVGVTRGWTGRRALLAGVLLGGAALAKLDGLALAPAVALALVWPSGDGRSVARRWLQAASALVVAALMVAPWLLVNRGLYHSLLPGAQARDLLSTWLPAFSTNRIFLEQSARNAFSTFWTGEPHGTLPLWRLETYLGLVITLLALLGLPRVLLDVRDSDRARAALAVLVVVVLSGMAAAVGAVAASGIGGLVPGRYLYPVVVPIAVLLGAGLWRALTPLPAVAVLLAYGVLSIANLGAFVVAADQPRVAPATPPANAVRVAASTQSRGLTVAVDQVALDAAKHRFWVHVRAGNAGTAPADWWPVPKLECGRLDSVADYAASTPIPARIPAGGSVDGWLAFPASPCAETGATTVRVVFPAVATNGYRDLGDVPVLVRLTG